MLEDKKEKIQFYKDYIREINRGNWRAELSIKTLEYIRDGIRLEFDRIQDKIKGISEEVDRKGKEANLTQEQIEEVKNLKTEIEEILPESEKARYLSKEALEKHEGDRVKDTRLKRENKMIGYDVKPELASELGELFQVIDRFQIDADALQEQMMGRFIESEGKYRGGLDEEIGNIQKKIVGGEEFQALIRRELKKL